jgi:hypothetical protein
MQTLHGLSPLESRKSRSTWQQYQAGQGPTWYLRSLRGSDSKLSTALIYDHTPADLLPLASMCQVSAGPCTWDTSSRCPHTSYVRFTFHSCIYDALHWQKVNTWESISQLVKCKHRRVPTTWGGGWGTALKAPVAPLKYLWPHIE